MIRRPEKRDFWRKRFLTVRKITEVYFGLLTKFPDFKKGEFTSPDGYFPDLCHYVYSKEAAEEQEQLFGHSPATHAHYVFLAQHRLEELCSHK